MSELTVLAAFAHPDDETILAGGILAMLVDQGATLHLLLATRGEGGELGEPPITDRSQLGIVREQELRCAAEALGADSVLFLDYVDPVVGDDESLHPFDAEFEGLAHEIATAMEATRAQVVITHGSNGEYGHPAHALMNRACKFGLQSDAGTSIPLYAISADFADHPRPRLANKDDPAHFVINIEPWLHTKLKAAECHRTQGALFIRRSSEEAGQPLKLPQVLMQVESLHRAWPPPDMTQSDPFSQFLREQCSGVILFDGLDKASGSAQNAS